MLENKCLTTASVEETIVDPMKIWSDEALTSSLRTQCPVVVFATRIHRFVKGCWFEEEISSASFAKRCFGELLKIA